MEYIDIKPFVGKEVEIVINRGLVHQRRIRHIGVLIHYEHRNMVLKSKYSKRNVSIRRPIKNRDEIRILEQEENHERP